MKRRRSTSLCAAPPSMAPTALPLQDTTEFVGNRSIARSRASLTQGPAAGTISAVRKARIHNLRQNQNASESGGRILRLVQRLKLQRQQQQQRGNQKDHFAVSKAQSRSYLAARRRSLASFPSWSPSSMNIGQAMLRISVVESS